MIIGDLNTTLEPVLDRKNYKTDNHKKSRLVINNLISENEILDFYRFTNGDNIFMTVFSTVHCMIKLTHLKGTNCHENISLTQLSWELNTGNSILILYTDDPNSTHTF